MWIRCRHPETGHEASIPVEFIDSGAPTGWKPLKGAKPSATFESPTYATPSPSIPPDDAETPDQSASSDNPHKE